MVAPLSEVPQEGSSVFSLFSLIKLHYLASHPLASSYSHVAVSSVFCAQYIHISAQTRGAPLNYKKEVVAGNFQPAKTSQITCCAQSLSLSVYPRENRRACPGENLPHKGISPARAWLISVCAKCCCCNIVVSHIQRFGCQPYKSTLITRWPIPLVVC